MTSELKGKVRNLVETMYGLENSCKNADVMKNQCLVDALKDHLGFCYKVSVDVVCSMMLMFVTPTSPLETQLVMFRGKAYTSTASYKRLSMFCSMQTRRTRGFYSLNTSALFRFQVWH